MPGCRKAWVRDWSGVGASFSPGPKRRAYWRSCLCRWLWRPTARSAWAGKPHDRVGVPFEVVVTAESAGFYKPRPEPYRAVLSALGTAPERTLFVAGSASDVPGAKGVGMAVYWHNRIGLPPRDDARPDYLEPTLDRLADLFPRP